MSNLKNDPNRDQKLSIIRQKLMRAVCENKSLKIDTSKIKNPNLLTNAIIEFDELYHDYLNICPLGVEEKETVLAYKTQFETFLQLFVPYLSITQENKFIDEYSLKWQVQDAKVAWKKWLSQQPINRPLREVYDVPANRAITEKFLHGELSLHEWLLEPDINRMLSAMNLRDKVHVTRLTTQDIGIILHFEREKNKDSQDSYEIPFIVNLGVDSHSNHQQQGYHWAKMMVKVNPKDKTVEVNYEDSLKLSATEKEHIQKELVKALNYQERSIEGNYVKDFAAFHNYKLTVNCNDSGEQQDNWTCGYRALKGIANDLKVDHPLVNCQSNQEMRDCVYAQILQNAEFRKDDLAKTDFATKDACFKQDDAATHFKPEVVNGLLLQLKQSPNQKESKPILSEEELQKILQIDRLVKQFAKLPLLQNLSNSEILSIDCEVLLQQAKEASTTEKVSEEIVHNAAIKSLFNVVAKQRSFKKWTIVNADKLHANAQELLLTELDNSPYFTQFESGDLNNEFNKKLKAKADIIATRNKIIAFYNADVSSENVDCWNVAVDAYFNDMPKSATGARYLQLYKEYRHPQELTDNKKELVLAMVSLGPVWFAKLLQYIRENRSHFDSTPFPYPAFNVNTDMVNMVEYKQYINAEFIQALTKEIQHPNQYLPFRSMYLRGKHFSNDAFIALKDLIKHLNKSSIQSIDFYCSDTDTPAANLTEEQYDEIIQLADEHKITTFIGFTSDSQAKSLKQKQSNLENIIARNRREAGKKFRLIKLGLTADEPVKKSEASSVNKAPVVKKLGKIRPYKTDQSLAIKNVSVEVQHQMQAQQQQEVQQQQQRQQQIQQQLERQKQNPSSFGEISSDNLIDKSHLKEFEDYFTGVTLGNGTVDEFWNTVVGENADRMVDKISKMTRDAFKALIKYYYLFRGGLNLDNLPRGFFLQKTNDNLFILCFDRVKFIENKNESPLTINYIAKKPTNLTFGDEKQFLPPNTEIPEFESDTKVLVLMPFEDPIYAKKIDAELTDIKDSMNKFNWRALENVFQEEGTLGIYIVFQNLQKIKNRNNDYYEDFKNSFFNKIDNPSEFLHEDYISAMEKICHLDAGKLDWWMALTKQHCDINPSPNLPDLFNAFEYFCKQLEKINPNATLPLPCPLTNIKNMKVSLDRLLVILNNAIDVQEQLMNLEGITLDNEGEFYASRYEGFYLVTKEMRLQPTALAFKKDEYIYQVKYDELKNQQISYADLKTLFYRYLGHVDCEPYLAAYQNYVNMIQGLDLAQNLTEDTKKLLIPILAFATTGPRAYQLNIVEASKNLFKAIEKIDPPNIAAPKLPVILREISQWQNAKPRLNLSEVSQFVEILQSLSVAEIPAIAKRIKDHISQGFVQAISNKVKNKDSLLINEFLNLIDAVSQIVNDEIIIDKVAVILAAVNANGIQDIEKQQFTAALKELCESGNKTVVHNVLDILGSIDIEKSANLPSIKDITTVIQQVRQLENPAYNSAYQCIAAALPNCSFNISNNDLSSKIDLDSLLKENLKDIIEYIEQNNVPFIKVEKLKGPGAAEYLLELIKKFDTSIPQFVQGKIKNFFRAKHEQDLISYALSKLSRYSAEIQNFISKKLNDSLFTADLPLMAVISGVEKRFFDTKAIIDLIVKINAKWPELTQNTFEVINNAINTSTLPIETINRVLQIILENCKDIKFPNAVLKVILNHPVLANFGKKEATALEEVLTRVMTDAESEVELKEKILNLVLLNLNNPSINIHKFTEKLLNYRNDNIYSLLIAHSSTSEELSKAKETTDELLEIFANLHEQNAQTAKKFFSCMAGFAKDYFEIAKAMHTITEGNRAAVLKIVTSAAFTFRNYNLEKVVKLLKLLNKQSEQTLNALAGLYDTKPFPQVDKLFEIAEAGFAIDRFITNFEKDPFGNRKNQEETNKLFDTDNVREAIEKIKDLSRDRNLNLTQKNKLTKAFHYVNMIGHSHPLQTNPSNPANGRLVPIKDFTRAEIRELINYYKSALKSGGFSDDAKKRMRLEYLALIREVMFRTTGNNPRSTQILSVLNAMTLGGNLLAEIRTGEGKGITTALFAAMLWAEGQSIDVCTSNSALAQRDLSEFASFYDYLGAKTTLITADSDPKEYCMNGINYSDVGQLALFQSRTKLEGHGEIISGNASLVLDEADFTIFDDVTQYRYAVNLDPTLDPFLNLDEWLYPMINDFVDSDIFNDSKTTGPEDIDNLRRYLLTNAKTSTQKDRINQISDRMFDTWLDSAFAASQLKENKHYVVREEARKQGKETDRISMARLLINERVSLNAQYSNGVQQFLHARLNKKIIENKDPNAAKRPYFPIDPEKAHVSSISSKNFIDQYRREDKRKGKVWGMTGTIGSKEERREQEEKYGFALFRMPPHKKNSRNDTQVEKPILAKNKKDHQQKIIANIVKRLRKNPPPPILIICKDIEAGDELHKLLEKELKKRSNIRGKYDLQLYNGAQAKFNGKDEDLNEDISDDPNSNNHEEKQSLEAKVILRAGLAGTITISTTMLGRGTDIKPLTRDGKKHENGLTVIQTYVDSKRSTGQNIGRSGRDGQKGEALLIVNAEEFRELADKKSVKNVTKAIKELRAQRNIPFKKQRQYRERFSDVRNQVFEKFLLLIDEVNKSNIDTINENKTDTSNKNNNDEINNENPISKTELRRDLLQQWEHYLSKLEKGWNDIALQKDSPVLPECVAALAKYACDTWNEFVEFNSINLQQANISFPTNLKLEQKKVYDEVFATVAKEKHIPQERLEESMSLPLDVNIDEIYMEMVPESKNNPLYQVNGIDIYKSSKIKQLCKLHAALNQWTYINQLPGKLDHENYLIETSKMFRLIFAASYETFAPDYKNDLKKDLINNQYANLMKIIKESNNPQLQKVAFDEHRINYLSKINQKHVHTEKYLQSFNCDMLNAQRQGTFGNNKIDDFKDESVILTNRSIMIDKLKEYSKRSFVATDRKNNAEALIMSLLKIDLVIPQNRGVAQHQKNMRNLFHSLNKARLDAMDSDLKANKKAWFFNRNQLGSRYQTLLGTIRERFVASCDAATLDTVAIYEFIDLKNIVKLFQEHVSPFKNQDVFNTLGHVYDNLKVKDLINIDKPIDAEYIDKMRVLYQVMTQLEQSLGGFKINDTTSKNFKNLLSNKIKQISLFLQQCDKLKVIDEPELIVPIPMPVVKIDATLLAGTLQKVKHSISRDISDLIDVSLSNMDKEIDEKVQAVVHNTEAVLHSSSNLVTIPRKVLETIKMPGVEIIKTSHTSEKIEENNTTEKKVEIKV